MKEVVPCGLLPDTGDPCVDACPAPAEDVVPRDASPCVDDAPLFIPGRDEGESPPEAFRKRTAAKPAS
ncbi:MAG: hypothetical protein ACJ8FZ_00190, partial [Bradyrhizobium sp.]